MSLNLCSDSDSRPIKVILVGSSGVGKTSIVERLFNNYFTSATSPTVGMTFRTIELISPTGKKVDVEIWDTAGEERYNSMIPMYYKNAKIVIFTFSVNDLDQSMNRMIRYLHDFYQTKCPDVKCLIVGNKTDLIHSDTNKMEEKYREDLVVKSHKATQHPFIFTSAKDGENINSIAEFITNTALLIDTIEVKESKIKALSLEEVPERKSCEC